MAAVFFGEGDDCLEIEFSGGGEDSVAGAVAAVEIVFHLFSLQVADGFGGAEDASAEGVAGEMGFHEGFVDAVAGVVEVHGDLFEDDLFFGVEIGLADGGAHELGEVLDGALGEFGEDVGEIGGVFLAGVGVVVGAHLVEDAVDVFPGVFFGAFEHHVLEEVGDAVDGGGFVAAAGVDVKAGGEGVGVGVGLGDDLKAVGEGGGMEFHAASIVLGIASMISG